MKKLSKNEKILTELVDFLQESDRDPYILPEMWLAIEECIKKTDVYGMEEIFKFHEASIKRAILKKVFELCK